jgi:hypothetical protein
VTPAVKVTAKSTVRVSVAGLCCYRPGHRSRLIYRTQLYHGRKGEHKGFRQPELIALLDAAHQPLQGADMLIQDRLSLHKTPAIRAAIARRPWLRVYELPAYAPELRSPGPPASQHRSLNATAPHSLRGRYHTFRHLDLRVRHDRRKILVKDASPLPCGLRRRRLADSLAVVVLVRDRLLRSHDPLLSPNSLKPASSQLMALI